MSTIDTINSSSYLFEHTNELFTELTPKAAEFVEGGTLLLNSYVHFDSVQYSRPFKNNVGTGISLNLNTKTTGRDNPDNNDFAVSLQRFQNGRFETIGTQSLPNNGGGKVIFRGGFWGGLGRGNLFRLRFSDERDGEFISGVLRAYSVPCYTC